MYTLEQLQQKTLKELKEIGSQLNVIPDGDRRCRQNWIDALIGTQPPLLQLLEVSPVAEVEPVQEAIEVQAHEHRFLLCLKEGDNTLWYDGKDFVFERWNAKTYCKRGVGSAKHQLRFHPEVKRGGTLQVVENFPAAQVQPVQEAIEVQVQEAPIDTTGTQSGNDLQDFTVQAQEPIETPPGVEVDSAKIRNDDYLDCPTCGTVRGLYATCPGLETVWETRCIHCDYCEPSIRHPFEDVRPFWVDRVRESIETPPGVESKFGRIVYPKPTAQEPIAQNAESRPQLDRTEGAHVHNRRSHPAESVRDNDGAETEALGSKEGDRVLALAGNHQAVRGRVLPHQSLELATFNDEQPPNRGDGKGRLEIEPKVSQSAILFEGCANGFCASPVTFSPRFLATYPPYFGEVRYKAEATGQLNLLESETEDEPPDPDDFESLDAFREAIALWDAEHPEPLEISLDSFCEWALCPDDWYEPAALLEPSEVSELSPASENSSTYNFSIPTFDDWCDRPQRRTDSDEPPDTGIFARLPGPKPPSFPPMSVVAGDRANRIKKFARSAALLSGRDPPGGDVM